jgi:hypothetical protein
MCHLYCSLRRAFFTVQGDLPTCAQPRVGCHAFSGMSSVWTHDCRTDRIARDACRVSHRGNLRSLNREISMMREPPFPMLAQRIAVTSARTEIRIDRVTEDSADSFPASDPPSWTPLRVGAPIQGTSLPGEHMSPHG